MSTQPLHVVVMAAGLGKRMKSALPKVVHPVLYRPLIHYVLDLAKAVGGSSVTVVVGHEEETVRKACSAYPEVKFVRQQAQRGTGDAVMAAEGELANKTGNVLVLSGDVILLETATVKALLAAHAQAGVSATVAVAELADGKGYGRIVRSGKKLAGIREDADCSPEEKKIREVNSGLYCFDLKALFTALKSLDNKNTQGEFYLTDAVVKLAAVAGGVELFSLPDADEMLGINDRQQLADVEKKLQTRINRKWMLEGVSMKAPESIWIDSHTTFEKDVSLEGPCVLRACTVKAGVVIEPGTRLTQCQLDKDVHVKQGTYAEASELGEGTSVGPYAHLRPGSRLGKQVKIGNFVEIKKATFGDGAKASHLSYIGDAEIGRNVNLGCGFITCNYDGINKYQTVIEDDVFVGSDSQTVAPVKIGKGSYVASATTVTQDVPPDSLAISRSKQVNKVGYATRLRSRQELKKK